MKNKMSDLRNHLFETLESLKDKDQPLDLARAKAVCEVAQTLINSAKVEVDFIKAIGVETGGGFFEHQSEDERRRKLAGTVTPVPRMIGSR